MGLITEPPVLAWHFLTLESAPLYDLFKMSDTDSTWRPDAVTDTKESVCISSLCIDSDVMLWSGL